MITYKKVSVLSVREKAESPYGERIVKGIDTLPIILSLIPKGDEREHFLAIYLDTRNHVIGASVISIGCLDASIVHPREVFRPAILLGAAHLIIAHNHPSGNVEPSAQDCDITRRLQLAGDVIGITLVDHIIVNETGEFYAFQAMGRL